MGQYKILIGKVLITLVVSLSMQNCIDPFEIQTIERESAIVIEASITDENRIQEILLTRTYALDTTGVYAERGATVRVNDIDGAIYDFVEMGKGRYVSEIAFAAQHGKSYGLTISTQNGKSYKSAMIETPSVSTLDSVYAVRDFKDGVEEGMFIYADSYDPSGLSQYFRYQYEETYKIIAPFWESKETYVITNDPLTIGIRTRREEERVCFKTENSINIIQTGTNEFGESRISKFPVRFINRDDFILSHRYSILVKQYIQSFEAYTYYQILDRLSSSESLFSQIQNGFFEGNITSEGSPNEKVLGFFDISTYSEKRIFFDYQDYFPGERIPKFVSDCPFLSPGTWQLSVERDELKYWDVNNGQYGVFTEYSPYIFVYSICGDCTVLGSNEVPDFWVED